jgi:carbon-monoxide dehydrogenase small subunit
MDGEPVRSCIVLAVQADGHEISTIEGLASDDGRTLHPVQRAFIEHHALQCGYCTPGFIMLIAGVLAREPDASPDRLRQLLSSNICRCTGYTSIASAALAAQQELNAR